MVSNHDNVSLTILNATMNNKLDCVITQWFLIINPYNILLIKISLLLSVIYLEPINQMLSDVLCAAKIHTILRLIVNTA